MARDLYQPGLRLVLPSGRRVCIDSVRSTYLSCRYVDGNSGAFGECLTLSRGFADRHCYLIGGAA